MDYIVTGKMSRVKVHERNTPEADKSDLVWFEMYSIVNADTGLALLAEATSGWSCPHCDAHGEMREPRRTGYSRGVGLEISYVQFVKHHVDAHPGERPESCEVCMPRLEKVKAKLANQVKTVNDELAKPFHRFGFDHPSDR